MTFFSRINFHMLRVPPMEIYFASVSKSPEVNRSLLDRIAEAIEFQLNAHVSNFWQAGPVKVAAVTTPESIPNVDGVCPIIVYDEPDDTGALGWHSFDPKTGRMPGTAFLKPILDNGGSLLEGPNSLSCTLSHEAIEAFVDPYVNDYSFVDEWTVEPKEACDRVQGDTYVIGGVTVSNFLGPRAFRDGPGPYDWLRLMTKPWEIRPAGYCMRRDVRTGEALTLWGEQVPAWYKEVKAAAKTVGLSRLGRRQRPSKGV